MSILIGHPTGTPFAYHAALSHLEAGRLEAFCVPWMPSPPMLNLLENVGPLATMVRRLRRRHFAPLTGAPLVQGRAEEWRRLLLRAMDRGGDRLVCEANEWLMRTMRRECGRVAVSAVHAYEDCALWSFAEAKKRGKLCVYDMPIAYHGAWNRIEPALNGRYADWLPPRHAAPFASPAQKSQEAALADLVLAPCPFVADSIREHHPDKPVALAPYGVDVAEWPFRERPAPDGVMTFLAAGQCSVRKGTPLLLEAWRAAGLKQARLLLVGSWHLADDKKRDLPAGCSWLGPVAKETLRAHYQSADVFVFPSNFEGFGLVVVEALSSGLPVITTTGRGADSVLDDASGRTVPPDDRDALVEALRCFDRNREQIPPMSRAARANAERRTWERYRQDVAQAMARALS
jgi:starch synthase